MRRNKRSANALKESETSTFKVPETITFNNTVFARLPTPEQWLALQTLQAYEEPGVPEYGLGAYPDTERPSPVPAPMGPGGEGRA